MTRGSLQGWARLPCQLRRSPKGACWPHFADEDAMVQSHVPRPRPQARIGPADHACCLRRGSWSTNSGWASLWSPGERRGPRSRRALWSSKGGQNVLESASKGRRQGPLCLSSQERTGLLQSSSALRITKNDSCPDKTMCLLQTDDSDQG